MTKYNGYELNYSIEELTKMTSEEMIDVTLLSEESDVYKNLQEGDKKALKHLVKASQILNDVSLEQDHPLNIIQKQALETASNDGDKHATIALKLFNSYLSC